MELKTTNGWFVFKFTRADYRQYGENRINTFLADLCKKVPKSDRHFYDEDHQWQIKDIHRPQFNKLCQKHFYPNYQKTLDLYG